MTLPQPLRGRRRVWFWQLTVLGIVESGALLGLGLGVRHAFDAVLVAGVRELGGVARWWIAAGFALVAVAALARGRQRWLGERFAQHYSRSVRARVMRRWLTTNSTASDGSRGTFALRMVGDTGALARWHGRVKARTIANVIAVASVTLVLGWFAWPLALAAMLPALAGGAGLVSAGRRLEGNAATARRARSRMLGRALHAVEPAAVANERSAAALPELDRRGRKLARTMEVAARDSGWIDAAGLFTTGGALMAALAAGTLLVAQNQVTPGTVLLATLWIGQLSRPIHELARAQDTWRRAKVSSRKLEAFLAAARGEKK